MLPRPIILLLSLLLLTACGSQATTASEQTENTSEPEGATLPNSEEDEAADPADASEDEVNPVDETDDSDADETDTTEPEPEPEPIDPACDVDGDGYISEACGGDDCDDENIHTHPDQMEFCDFIDNNCNELVNDEIVCTVYAHTSNTLYEVDPFLGTIENISSIPGLFDFDTSIEGTLYGITPSSLYVYNETTTTWNIIGSITGMAGTSNGFAIDSTGRAFATSGSNVYNVNLLTGEFSLVGNMGSSFNSSGDCVVDKSDGLFMTSNGTGAINGDDLVQISTTTGEATVLGSTGYSSIYGLTAAWGYMFGFTGGGQVVLLDSETGAGTLLHSFSGYSFYGAASSPIR